MIKFLKENGFPMTLILETTSYSDSNGESGYLTTVTDENEVEVGEFRHIELRDRIHWVDGFFTALRMKKQ